MKIEIEINNEPYSWKSDYEDHNIYDIAEKFKGLLVSAGFHPNNVDDLFDECAIGTWRLPSETDTESKWQDDDEDDIFVDRTENVVTTKNLK